MRPSTQRKLATWLASHLKAWKCECGCGEYITPTVFHFNHRHRYRPRFIPKHQNRGKNHPPEVGTVIAKGYVWYRAPQHRLANPRGYVKRCWLVAERRLQRPLLESEHVHHKDGDKLNDAPENILVLEANDHRKHHSHGEMNPRFRRDVDTEMDIVPLIEQGMTYRAIASQFHCSRKMIVDRMRTYRAARKAA